MIDCVYLIFLTGLILCSEPYYNEAGYEKQRGTAEGRENSRMYSEMVLLKLVQSMERLLNKPPEGLQNEILQHFAHHGARLELLKAKKKKKQNQFVIRLLEFSKYFTKNGQSDLALALVLILESKGP